MSAARERAERLLAEIKVRAMSADAISLIIHHWEKCRGIVAEQSAATVLKAARDKARKDFAQSRGWRLSREFTLENLKKHIRGKVGVADDRPVLDHLEYYVKDRRPAGIVSHGYCEWRDCVAFAELHGLRVEQLPFSWYRPDSCVAAVFSRRDGAT